MQTNEFVYKYTNNTLPQVFINQYQQISSISPYNIRSATKYRPVFVVLMLNSSELDRLLGSWDSQSGMIGPTPGSIRSVMTLQSFTKNYRNVLQGFNLTLEVH